MSYLVLARKYRPQVFDDIVGQDHLIRTLTNAISGGRVAHAYLFCGPRGVGKTTAARILAKALNCEKGPAPVPCNACDPCREITEGRSMDVLEIDGASNRGINEVRELRENVRYAPSGGRSKVYIIDEVHMLTTEAFNALLKTLEEPPAHVVFVFATTEPFKVPPTILSRVQRFDFARIPARKIADHLARIMEQEGIETSPEALSLVARRARGGLRDALSLMDQIISAAEGKIGRETVEEFLGLIGADFYSDLVNRFAAQDAGGAIRLLDSAYSRGADLGDLAEGLATHLRDLMLLGLEEDLATLLDAPASEIPGLTEQASKFSADALVALVDLAAEAAAAVRRSEHPRLALELALAEMAGVAGRMSLAELSARLLELEKTLEGKPGRSPDPGSRGRDKTAAPRAPSPSRKPAPPDPEPSGPGDATGEAPPSGHLERRFLDALKQESMSLWGMLHTTDSISFRADGTLVITPSNPVTAERVAESECRKTLIRILAGMGAREPRLVVSGVDPEPEAAETAATAAPAPPGASGDSAPGPAPAPGEPPGKGRPEAKADDRSMGQIFKDEPMLQKALDMFDGEVLP